MEHPVLYIVIPCYNEQEVLPITAPMFLNKLSDLADRGLISDASRVLFVNDGSGDKTWDISISIDCDGQDDINAMDDMVRAYLNGCDIVYGVRSDRESDSFFKRTTAQGFYKFLSAMGADIVYNHADYRLISARALRELAKFEEVNLFLRGMVPLVGFKSTSVEYKRAERLAGKSKYPLRKMLSLAGDGITSLSIKPLRLIMSFGLIVAFLSFVGVIWAIVSAVGGHAVAGWASTTCIICFVSGVQLVCMGIIGEYIGKIYMETKHRPRYIISERTWDK